MDPVVVRRAITVCMTDVDLVQINFQSYFRWMDHGFNDLLRALGGPLGTLISGGHATPVVDARCRYVRPVTLDDSLTLTSCVGSVGTTSFTVLHHFAMDGHPVAEGALTHVWISLDDGRPRPVPDWLRTATVDHDSARHEGGPR